MNLRSLFASLLFVAAPALSLRAQAPTPPKTPMVSDTALKVELVATFPEVEACTTVCGGPNGAIYVGNDARDGRVNSSQPVNTIVRFSGLGPDRKRTVFADKIYSPAGSAWHDGWLYVLHDPLLTRFKDTKGDGVADVREDLITNLGVSPYEGLNDHVVSGFTLGMDGYFYISVGDRGIYQAKSVKDGSTITMQGGGIVRCRPDGTKLEIFSTGTRNHLQVNLDAEDNAFTRDNTDDGNGWWTRVTHHIEGGYYGYPYLFRSYPNLGVIRPSNETLNAIKQHGGMIDRTAIMSDGRKVADVVPADATPSPKKTEVFLPALADFGGGSPTGGLCYLSDGLPEQYRGRHFFSEWGKGGIFVTEVARDGATFKLVSDTKLVEPEKGGDFRPMQLSVAADGSLLIADWGYGGWKSPRIAGAIWRVSWPEAKIAPRLKDESKASVDDLIGALGHPDRDQRLRAQGEVVRRVLAEVAGAAPRVDWKKGNLAQRLSKVMSEKSSPAVLRLHALWAWTALCRTESEGGIQSPLLSGSSTRYGNVEVEALLDDPSAAIRAQAVRAIAAAQVLGGPWSAGTAGVGSTARVGPALVQDPDPAVRLQVAIARAALGDFTPVYVKLLGDTDPWVRFATRAALREYMARHYPRVGGDNLNKDFDVIAAALTSPDPAVRDSAWLIFPLSLDARMIHALGNTNHPEFLENAGTRTAALIVPLLKASDPSIRAHAVNALACIAYQPQPYDGHWWGTQPVKSPPPPNTVAWSGTPSALTALTAALSDSDTGVRLAAAKAFTAFVLNDAGKDAGAALRARLTAETEPTIRRQLIESLGVQKDPLAMDVFRQIALDEKADPEFRETAISAVVNIGGDAAKQTISQLAAASLSPVATRKIITAAGDLKVLDAAPALIAHLKDENAGNREVAAKSLQQLGPKSNAGPALIAALADKDGKVMAAAIEAIGSYRDKSALPALIALAEKKRSMKEVTGALANMPDESAIPVLVESLRDKNTGNRRNAIKALKSMREKAWPQVEALLASGRVPEELVPEIRNAFESGAITKWKMIGVFENVWDAVHPPEKDALANGGTPNLTAKYHNAEGKDVGWIDVTADADAGKVDLEKTFKTTAMVCAYAYTEIEAPEASDGKLFTSADDEIAVWLNGQKLLDQPGSHGYEPDKNETHVHLNAGKNRLFLKIGNKSGSWVFHARMPGFDNGKFIKSKDPLPDEKQRLFALAMKADGSYVNAGNPKNGEKLFFDQTGPLGAICATCHTINGKGGQVGPDLSAIAANYKRPDLITSILEPSKTIALGFEQFMIETKGGETFAGALRQDTGDAFTLVGVDAKPHVIKKTDVKTKTAIPTSLMPPGLTLGLKVEDFLDLVAFLETLKGK